jgi:ribonuclease Z
MLDEPGATGTLRERLAAHRANPECAACHDYLDPIGLGLENYDAIGAWRTLEGGVPIDATGEFPDGRTFDGADFCGPDLKGRTVVYCTDTIYCRAAVELARDADLLIHEATFAEADEGLAIRSTHSTAAMAGRVAQEAGARRLYITHFSPRYFPGNQTTPDDLLQEARAVFPETEMAHDFLSVDVERRE